MSFGNVSGDINAGHLKILKSIKGNDHETKENFNNVKKILDKFDDNYDFNFKAMQVSGGFDLTNFNAAIGFVIMLIIMVAIILLIYIIFVETGIISNTHV